MSLLRDAIVDARGQVDVANLALVWLFISVLGAITFACAMELWAYARCSPTPAQVVNNVVIQATTCAFDPQPLGLAVGAICGGFATCLTALAIYIRRDPNATYQGDRNERDRCPPA